MISVQNSVFLNNNTGLTLTGDSLGTVVAYNIFKFNELGVNAQSCAQFHDNVITQNYDGAQCGGVVLWQNQINDNLNIEK